MRNTAHKKEKVYNKACFNVCDDRLVSFGRCRSHIETVRNRNLLAISRLDITQDFSSAIR